MQAYGYGNQPGAMNGMNGQPGQEQLPWLPLLESWVGITLTRLLVQPPGEYSLGRYLAL